MKNTATNLVQVINPYLLNVNQAVKNIIAYISALFKQDKPRLHNLRVLKNTKQTIARSSHAQDISRSKSSIVVTDNDKKS